MILKLKKTRLGAFVKKIEKLINPTSLNDFMSSLLKMYNDHIINIRADGISINRCNNRITSSSCSFSTAIMNNHVKFMQHEKGSCSTSRANKHIQREKWIITSLNRTRRNSVKVIILQDLRQMRCPVVHNVFEGKIMINREERHEMSYHFLFTLGAVIVAASLTVFNKVAKQIPWMTHHLHWAPRLWSKQPPTSLSCPTPHRSCCCGNGSSCAWP